MQCTPFLTTAGDTAFWIPRKLFCKQFDQNDFNRRESKSIFPAYLLHWFEPTGNFAKSFVLPTVHFVSGKTQFINGRHRTAVLLMHMENIPIAFTEIAQMSNNWRRLRSPLAINPRIPFEIPDLPILDRILPVT